METLCITSELQSIAQARTQFFNFLKKNAIGHLQILRDWELIFTEALTNAILHGNKSDKNKPVYLNWTISDLKTIELQVSDWGTGPSLENAALLPDSNQENGCGLYIIQQLCDTCEHNFPDSGGYRQILRKSIHLKPQSLKN